MDYNIIQNEFPLKKNSYTAFDAISLRNLIIERLNDEGFFTDQNFIGSNLASIIDIIAFAFNTLIFYLNQTSSESTFTEAQLYENINKIVKLLDYNPIGYQTSTLVFEASANANFDSGVYTIPRYSFINAGSTSFSFNEDITFVTLSGGVVTPLNEISNSKLLYQGVYRENSLYIAAGDPSEVVFIEDTSSSIDHFNIDVYVYENNLERWVEYKKVNTFYGQGSTARVFEKRINPNKQYEITFGNSINGRQLNKDDKVLVYYLESSGQDGIVGPQIVQSSNNSVFNTLNYIEVINDIKTDEINYINSSQFNNIIFNNQVGSTNPQDIETPESIKRNAPANFKSQYRLVTKEDYENFIRTNFANFISDIRVYSNWDYTGKYLRYFYNIQVSPTDFRQILLNQILFADSCNFNNIYICAVPKVSFGSSLKYLLPAQKEIILSDIKPLKMLTTEVVFMDPIYKSFSLGVPTNNKVDVEDGILCRLEVVKSSSSQRSAQSIKKDVENVFTNFFNITNLVLGRVFDYSKLISEIFAIPGVQEIKTVREDTNESFSGLSLFMWNPTYPELDKKTVTSNVEMNEFEVYYFDNINELFSKIIVKESVFNIQ